jgi:cobalt-zinc-cadmium efflux system outer membrane protein
MFHRRSPHRPAVGLAVALVGLCLGAGRARADAPEALDVDSAIARALRDNPAIVAARSALSEADARVVGAGTYPHNPVLGLEAGARRGPSETSADLSVELTQSLELGGQTGRRRAAAAADRTQLRAEFETIRRALATEVRVAFVGWLRARELRVLETSLTSLAAAHLETAEKRLAAGATTRLEVNLARAEAGRARAALATAQGAEDAARALLAALMGRDPDAPLDARGTLTLVDAPMPAPADLRRLARERRPELEAARAAVEGARARLDAAEAAALPDVEVGAFFRREGADETVAGGGLSWALPLFARQQGERAEADAERVRRTAEAAATALRIDQEVTVALAERRAAYDAARALQDQVTGALDENLTLLQRAFDAGEIGATELLVARLEFRSAGRERIDALSAAEQARARLELAAGTLALPPESAP